jgi:hypothetical protein
MKNFIKHCVSAKIESLHVFWYLLDCCFLISLFLHTQTSSDICMKGLYDCTLQELALDPSSSSYRFLVLCLLCFLSTCSLSIFFMKKFIKHWFLQSWVNGFVLLASCVMVASFCFFASLNLICYMYEASEWLYSPRVSSWSSSSSWYRLLVLCFLFQISSRFLSTCSLRIFFLMKKFILAAVNYALTVFGILFSLSR